MLSGIFILTGTDMPTARAVLLDINGERSLRDVQALGSKRGWTPARYLSAVFGERAEYAWRATEAMCQHLVGLDPAAFNVPHRETVQALAALLLMGEPIPGDDAGDDNGGARDRLVPPAPTMPPSGNAAIPESLRF